jgi:hypothetical protein
MAITLKDRTKPDYVKLGLNMSIADCRRAMSARPGCPGVVFDGEKPVTIIGPEDLEFPEKPGAGNVADVIAQLPPGIIVPSSLALDAFAGTGVFSALTLGAHGAVVIDEEKVVGILPASSVDDALPFITLGDVTRSTTMPDSGLAGAILTGKVVLYCEAFGHRNELAYYNRRHPPQCQVTTPHAHAIRGVV